jgi:hypothetical protein
VFYGVSARGYYRQNKQEKPLEAGSWMVRVICWGGLDLGHHSPWNDRRPEALLAPKQSPAMH